MIFKLHLSSFLDEVFWWGEPGALGVRALSALATLPVPSSHGECPLRGPNSWHSWTLAVLPYKNTSDFPVVSSACLMPVVVRHLTGPSNQVGKTFSCLARILFGLIWAGLRNRESSFLCAQVAVVVWQAGSTRFPSHERFLFSVSFDSEGRFRTHRAVERIFEWALLYAPAGSDHHWHLTTFCFSDPDKT